MIVGDVVVGWSWSWGIMGSEQMMLTQVSVVATAH